MKELLKNCNYFMKNLGFLCDRTRIILKKFGADYLFADVDRLMELSSNESEENKENPWKVRWFSSLLYLKECKILFSLNKNTKAEVFGKNLMITEDKNPKFARFDINAVIKQKNRNIYLNFNDNNAVYIKDKVLHIRNGIFKLNKSKVIINATLNEKNEYDLNLSSKDFQLENVKEVTDTNLVIPNGREMLKDFKDVKGLFDFDINY